MPVYNRKQLRGALARNYIHDMPNLARPCQVATLAFTSPVVAQNIFYADLGNSGHNLYVGAWMYLEVSVAAYNTGPSMYQYMIATFNAGTGAFISDAPALDAHNAIGGLEIHTRVPPYDKDYALDETIKRLRIRQEVALNTIDGALLYALDGAASPYALDRILDIHVFANPTGTQDRNIRHVDDWQVVTEATGTELRLLHALQGSQQLVFDAILIPTLGGELATINIPDERWVLSGAAARCYDFMIQNAPAQQVALLQQRRQEHATEFSRLTTRFAPVIDKPIRLNDIVSGRGGQYPDNSSGWW